MREHGVYMRKQGKYMREQSAYMRKYVEYVMAPWQQHRLHAKQLINYLLENDKTGFIKNTCLFRFVQGGYWLFKVQSHQHTPLLTFSSDAILLF